MEITGNSAQTVTAGSKVIFDAISVPSTTPCILTRIDSGTVILRGIVVNGCRARFRIYFQANVAIPNGVDAGATGLVATVNGNNIEATTMIITPTVANAFFNVSASTFIDVPAGCAVPLSIENNTTASIEVQNANLIVERVA